MAESANSMQNSVPEDLQGGKTDKEKDKDWTRFYIDLAQRVTRKIAEHAFEVEMSPQQKKKFCACVEHIIVAYENKIQEIKGLEGIIRQMKKKSQEKSRKIKQLGHINDQLCAQLASAVCEKCGAEGVREKFTTLSMQPSMESGTEVDGQAVENQEVDANETNSASDEEQQDEDGKLTCPYDAGCVFFAFVCLFNKMDINFCSFKFIQKFGAVNRHKKPTCTNILKVMVGLRFIERAHSCDTQQENHNEKLNEIAQKLVEKKQKAGLLWYSKEETNHCVTVYVGSTGAQMKIQDAQLNQNYITDLQSVRKFILFVLKCDSKGEPLIKNKWNAACNAKICEEESKMLDDSLPIHNDSNEGV